MILSHCFDWYWFFDDINELYGFTTGNLVLAEVGKILNEFANRYSVTLYRIYGNVYCLADKKWWDSLNLTSLLLN